MPGQSPPHLREKNQSKNSDWPHQTYENARLEKFLLELLQALELQLDFFPNIHEEPHSLPKERQRLKFVGAHNYPIQIRLK